MIHTDEFIESEYTKLCTFDEENEDKTVLLRLNGTTQLFVRKELDENAWELSKRLKTLENSHIVKPENVYKSKGHFYIIEPYIGGMTLEDAISQKGLPGRERAADIVLQILDGLSALHSIDIVHRDVTPANIIITNEGTAKLLDYDIIRINDPHKTKDTQILGTQGYAAPEQFGFRQTDSRADIYAVGVLFNVLLTGDYPQDNLTTDYFYRRIIEKAISIDPKDRYDNVRDMIADIDNDNVQEDSVTWKKWRNTYLPGFRTGKTWKRITARIMYAGMIFFWLVYILDIIVFHYGHEVREFVSATLTFIIAPLELANIGYWDRRIPLLSRMPKGVRVAVRIIVFIILFAIGMELYVGVSNQYRK